MIVGMCRRSIFSNLFCMIIAMLTRPVMPLTDWLRGNQRSREWMEKLAKQLNSGEDIDVVQGDFFVELLFFKKPGRGGASRGKKHNPG